MKRVATLLALLLLTAALCRSQTRLCFDSTAVRIDSISAQAAVASGPGGSCNVAMVLFVWRALSGKNYYSIVPESIQFTGNCTEVDALSTSKIFDMLAVSAVSVGITRGYTPCIDNCGLPTTTRVAAAECLQRTGSGITTRFTACTPEQCCYREFNVCCAGGVASPTITLFNRVGMGCPQTTPPCQSTCQ